MQSKKEGRVCIECNEFKSYSDFHKNRSNSDGHQNRCKICRKKIYYKKDKSKKSYYDRLRYSSLNEEDLKKRSLKRRLNYLKNKQRDLVNMKRYRKKNINIIKRQIRKNSMANAIYFDTFYRLTVEESPRLAKDNVSLEIKCRYCGKYFIPTKSCINRRINALKGTSSCEGVLYCSEGCKKSCPIYGKHKYPSGFKKSTSREVQPELRQLVLARDNWQCQKCGKSVDEVELHCHHILPINESPVESADVDNCITLCKEHHKEVHRITGCGFNELKCNEWG
jgi:hypothetical protein